MTFHSVKIIRNYQTLFAGSSSKLELDFMSLRFSITIFTILFYFIYFIIIFTNQLEFQLLL